MRLERNTLAVEWDRWDDPGDYPSGAGSGPMRSFDYVADVTGEIVLILEPEDLAKFTEAPADGVVNLDAKLIKLPAPVTAVSWKWSLDGDRLTLTVDNEKEIEAGSRDDYDDPEPDYIIPPRNQ